MTTTRTISLRFSPANGANSGRIQVDIGKFYDQHSTRVSSCWVRAYYNDLTAAARSVEASCHGSFENVTVMELPAANITVLTGGGTAFQVGPVAAFVSGIRNEYVSDVQLTQPLLEISITGEKNSLGGFAASFNFIFHITVQLEFGVPPAGKQFELNHG